MSFIDFIKDQDLKGAKYTTSEIDQQPELWLEAFQLIVANKERIESFLQKYVFSKKARIIFTGAGTSAYVGDTASPLLRKKLTNQVVLIDYIIIIRGGNTIVRN